MHNSIKIDFEGIALEDGGTIVKDIPYVVGLKNFHFILSNLSLGGTIQNDISAEGIVTLESVIENEGQEDEFTSYHQQIVFKNVYGYDVTIYDKTVTASLVMTPEDVIDEIEGGTLDNAKPIYIHPILLYSQSTKYRLQFLLFNNDPTPFNSKTDLFAYLLQHLSGAYIMANGLFNGAIVSYLNVRTDSIGVSWYDDNQASGVNATSIVNFSNYESIIDGVNKIN